MRLYWVVSISNFKCAHLNLLLAMIENVNFSNTDMFTIITFWYDLIILLIILSLINYFTSIERMFSYKIRYLFISGGNFYSSFQGITIITIVTVITKWIWKNKEIQSILPKSHKFFKNTVILLPQIRHNFFFNFGQSVYVYIMKVL